MHREIHDELLDAISSFLKPYADEFYDLKIFRTRSSVEVQAQLTETETTKALLLKVLVSDQYERVEIPNIYLPPSIRKGGVGKSLIKEVQRIAKNHGRSTFVSELTQSFYEQLRRRGARVVNNEVVEITDETKLE